MVVGTYKNWSSTHTTALEVNEKQYTKWNGNPKNIIYQQGKRNTDRMVE